MNNLSHIEAGLAKRYRAERRFKVYGIFAIAFAVVFLIFMIGALIWKGSRAIVQAQIRIEVTFDPAVIDPEGKREPKTLAAASYQSLVKKALRDMFPDVHGRRGKRALYALVSIGAGDDLRAMVLADPGLIGKTRSVWVLASDDVDVLLKQGGPKLSKAGGSQQGISRGQARIAPFIARLEAEERLTLGFNRRFFTSGDSREPELAGILGAVLGSAMSLSICFLLAFPLGLAAAVYLEELAPRNRWVDIIEININNLAAVPSIVFGLLGLSILLGFFGLPRSSPLVGGMVLALMTLPTIIISARAALQAVPDSLRRGALALGATRQQAIWHQVLPLAMPGMLTGTIIGMAQALGESAPLLLIGMVAFVVDLPGSLLDGATALPVQIFLWADSPERAFEERTAAAILVLLAFLILMNLFAVLLRRRFEKHSGGY